MTTLWFLMLVNPKNRYYKYYMIYVFFYQGVTVYPSLFSKSEINQYLQLFTLKIVSIDFLNEINLSSLIGSSTKILVSSALHITNLQQFLQFLYLYSSLYDSSRYSLIFLLQLKLKELEPAVPAITAINN